MIKNVFASGCRILLVSLVLIILSAGHIHAQSISEVQDNERSVRILATSDIHGKFYPYLYAQNTEDTSGSLAQLATAIKEFRNEDTILVDCGDSIQDNSADIFLGEDIHPMIEGLNRLGFDIGVTGNHEFNFGIDVTKKTIASFAGKVLVGNVYDQNGEPLADGYTILDRDGVRIAIIGMVTPYIQFWDDKNLEGCTVTDPVEETRKIIDSIRGQYDVLVGAMHMGVEKDYEYPHSSARELAEECPEFDVIIASHEHVLVEGEIINGVLVVENKHMGKTMSVIDISLSREGEGWAVSEVKSKSLDMSKYNPDPEFMEAFLPYHEYALQDAMTVIGHFDGDYLVEKSEIDRIPRVIIEDSAYVDLINNVLMHYGEATVSSTAASRMDCEVGRGDIHKCDMSMIYRYYNTLYTFRMTGSQLKALMEWEVGFINQYKEGDLTISFEVSRRTFNYHMFSGVNYEIDISQEIGSRIRNLTWPDGRPVEDDDSFIYAVDSYCANNFLLRPGAIYSEDDMPELIARDLRSDLGGIADMILDYIVNECDGVLVPQCDNNWRIVGNDWDPELHQQIVEYVRAGKLEVPCPFDVASGPITEDDLKAVSGE